MAEPAVREMTLDEFLRWDDGTDTRYELVGGCVVAMAPPAWQSTGVLALAAGSEILKMRCSPIACAASRVEAGIFDPNRPIQSIIVDIAVSCEALRAKDGILGSPDAICLRYFRRHRAA